MHNPRYVSDAIVDLISSLGCRYVPLNPGSSIRGLHESLVNHRVSNTQSPEVVLCTHEEICLAAGHAYAKATGSVGWALVHDLVGLMHASMGIYNAWCDNTPLVVLGGGGPIQSSKRRAIDWLHSANVQSELVRPFVKYGDDPAESQSTLDSVAQAWQLAGSRPHKPTYVTVDAGIQEEGSANDLEMPNAQGFAPTPPFVSRNREVGMAAEILWSAERPVVVGGQVGLSTRCTSALVEIVELLGAAYLDERNIVAFPTGHPHNITGDNAAIDEGDALLTVDVQDLNWVTSGGKTSLGGFRAQNGYQGRIVDLSNSMLAMSPWANADRAPRPVDVRLQGDPLEVLLQLREALLDLERAAPYVQREERNSRAERIAVRHRRLRNRQVEAVEKTWSDYPVSPSRMVAELWAAVQDRDWRLLMRNVRSWPEGWWQFSGGGQYLGHNGGGGVGYGPGALLGGAIAARDRGQLPVGIIGDGDFLTGTGVIWTAVHNRVPMLVVVNNNRSYYQDEVHQGLIATMRGRSAERAHMGTRIHQPDIDFGMVARSNGGWAPEPIHNPEHLRPVFEEAVERVARGSVALIDVRTGPE